nr:hypothetical protein [Bacteroidota bacterium]
MRKLIILLLFPFALFGQDVQINTAGAGDVNINVAGAGNLQLYRPVQFTFTADGGDMDFGGKLSTLSNIAVVINFGDGTSERVEGTNVQLDHTYSTTGDYTIWIDNAINLTKLDFGYYGNQNATQYNLSGDIIVVQNLTNLTHLY